MYPRSTSRTSMNSQKVSVLLPTIYTGSLAQLPVSVALNTPPKRTPEGMFFRLSFDSFFNIFLAIKKIKILQDSTPEAITRRIEVRVGRGWRARECFMLAYCTEMILLKFFEFSDSTQGTENEEKEEKSFWSRTGYYRSLGHLSISLFHFCQFNETKLKDNHRSNVFQFGP